MFVGCTFRDYGGSIRLLFDYILSLLLLSLLVDRPDFRIVVVGPRDPR